MAKKVFKGWCSKQDTVEKVFRLDEYGDEYETSIFKTRSDKYTWGEFHWPPKRVTVTVEVEE